MIISLFHFHIQHYEFTNDIKIIKRQLLKIIHNKTKFDLINLFYVKIYQIKVNLNTNTLMLSLIKI
jgi:hypothetical protein